MKQIFEKSFIKENARAGSFQVLAMKENANEDEKTEYIVEVPDYLKENRTPKRKLLKRI